MNQPNMEERTPLPGDPPYIRRRRVQAHRTQHSLSFWIALIVTLVALLSAISLSIAYGVHQWRLRVAEEERITALAREKAQHPFYYRDLVEAYASKQGLDPAFVAAIILKESSFKPDAISEIGARGLMQLMPDTAEWVAHKLDEDATYSFDRMFDPETNIRYGTWFLGYLQRKFQNDPVKMAAGYHAGGGRVSEWLANPAYSANGKSLDTIPYQDTDRYVQRVMIAYAIYQKHYYPPVEPTPSDTPSAIPAARAVFPMRACLGQ
ncbi:MAG: lytic transglycosylase domain-containing protein [Clostridia bacterium]